MSEKRKLSDETENDKEDAFKASKQSKLCEAGSSTIDYDAPIKVQMSSNYLSKEFLANFSKFWNENESFSDSSVDLLASPFKLACLKDFLTDKDSLLQKLVQEMTEISFDRRQMDLYEFYQSTDLVNFESQPAMRMFYAHLRDTVMPWMEKLTGIKLSHISASCSMYNAGDYLLVHDDLMTDRRVAFVYYISPWKGAEKWTSEMGGALELFENREKEPLFPVKKRIPPTNNQFVFFRVGSDSFHQVGEVTNFDFPRLTINGWFHGPSADDETATKIPQIDLHYTTPHEKTTDDALYELVNPIYLKTEYKEDIHKQIEENSEASLEEFLDEDFYDQILTQIQQIPADSWQLQGPANVRNYEVLTLNEKTPSIVAKFMEIFQSKAFFKLLHEYTELDLHGANVAEPKCSVELQRWTRGCYTVLGDPSQYADCTLDLIFYINAYPQVGVVTYLSPEEDSLDDEAGEEEEEIDPILLTIHPKDNALNLVYRNEGITKFTKYVSKNCLKEGKYSYILVCRYKE
ncbi:prolyl 3-hydroxylase sudestada1-like isoform X2 [Culicoides brevitarsis]|uniref:prolyl 3-hydroxylase sudestada1-like isoform X2 n=1 Tax=Culicoides brevitarsis TaxID=469753 RepID=UPI00307B531D